MFRVWNVRLRKKLSSRLSQVPRQFVSSCHPVEFWLAFFLELLSIAKRDQFKLHPGQQVNKCREYDLLQMYDNVPQVTIDVDIKVL